ncbi:MAG: 30S ribosomal protein S9 [Candidatus Wildermuthbacteria bacterium RIFCSPLOWO2_02_FULL_47_9c]|uniref:30S ribosomal protein S9 n=2 Tax=Parcubacteria group TaxID=1794811 RepID=A0A837IQ24_9BACT|nr:MAG: 30S ribosomal protein S9 [Candidatus Yanofskybacteria bacterium GW2011_GWC1_48_11]KKW04599.1 MAG: 30S ribosomal protein S9 [Parcubacteria group bacterium GW2011_GWB1_49_12]KKW09143.1 MAG: 30S ribosomal protein S9 [Parcubacteria group bacterium GW2011_GWA1_49_26]KKW13521.1 MAG: 30S ribosomal protein S9 [Parcubacteria group bacterium GW2011_GWA2_50_10]OHA61400.1 MAG: 30S ribosomal protein S9 [Candidatus Wildermuthbacteria bacterium GWA1_49_26]OHA66257.1 MAG: 30S ribosomal protein S9 [Can
MPRVSAKKTEYVETVGRRKTAVARIRLSPASKSQFIVNQKPLEEYVQETSYQNIARESLEKGSPGKSFAVSVLVRGGGPHAQAEAIRQGISRALVKTDPELRANLKALGFLTRDSRMRERKKFGLKRARRARQWRKR